MNLAGLSLDRSPPLSAPARFFLTAPLFGVAAGLLLLWLGPEALAGRWTPGALALTHLLTLGFLAMVMIGAMMQMLPVVAGSALPRPRLSAALTHLPLTLGTPLLAWGLLGGGRWPLGVALVSLAVGFMVFLGAAGLALWRARTAFDTVAAMRLAVIALAVTVGLGLWLAHGHLGGALPRHFTDVHAAWGLGGWVALLVAGVAYQVVPLFQITPEYPPRLRRWLARTMFAALLLLGLGRLAMTPWLEGLAATLLALALLLFAGVTLRLQRRRKRRINDAGVWFWRLALVSLVLSLPLWWLPGVPPLLPGVLFLAGFAISLMSGMLYKIFPFLVWLHLNNRVFRAGAAGVTVPTMKQVISDAAARRQLHVHAAAVPLLAAATLWPEWLAYPAALAFTASSAMLAWNLATGLRVYRRVAAQL